MNKPTKDDAWQLGFNWAIGTNSILEKGDEEFDIENPDPSEASLVIMPQFEEGVEAGILERKKRELQDLITGETHDTKEKSIPT